MHDTVEQAFVWPRYLAGGGDPAWITVPLRRACGWRYGPAPLMPGVLLTSPDQQTELHLAPDSDEPWWSIRHAPSGDQHAWSATFDAHTPVEIIAAVTDALTAPGRHPASAPHPYDLLRQAGWHTVSGALVCADGIAAVEHYDGSDSWFAEATLSDDPADVLWRACFDSNVPPRLIAAFAQSLADPTPLLRTLHHVPLRGREHMRIRVEQRPVQEAAFALEQRVADLAARRAGTTAPVPAARPPHVPQPRRTR